MTDDAIVIEIVYPHPVDRLWRALTTSDALTTWLMPNDFTPAIGHHFTFRTEAQHGWNGIVECEVTALDPPRRVAYTWRGGLALPTTLVTFTLEPAPGGTRLRLVHSGFAAGGPAALSIRDILGSGWDSKLLREQLPALLDQMAADEYYTSTRSIPMSARVVLISLYVRDLAGMQAFYTDRLGMEVVPQFTGPDFVFLRSAAGTPLALRPISALPPGMAATPGSTEVSFDVDDLDVTYQAWKAQGVEIVSDITDIGAGRAFLARDPEGHTLGVSQLYDGVREYRRQLGL